MTENADMMVLSKAREAIANVVDFWMEDRGEPGDAPHRLGEHNADRILMALDDAGLKLVPKSE